MPATHTYGSLRLEDHGHVTHGLARTYENAEDGRATSILYRYTVNLVLTGDRFADIEASLATIRAYLEANPEALLLIRDEDESTLHERRVRIVTDTTPEAWRQFSGEIQLVFTARDGTVADSAADATYTPTGGAAVTLPNIRSYAESVRTERVDPALAHRVTTRRVIALSGTLAADPALDETARREWLFDQKTAIQTAALSKSGSFAFAGETHVVECESLDANLPGDGSDKLEWSATFSHQIFPGGDDYAEAVFEVAVGTDYESGDVTLGVSGSVRAATETAARAKAEAIRDHYRSGRALLKEDIRDRRHSGADTVETAASGDFIDLSFSFTYRDTSASILRYELKVATKTDERTGLQAISYSGRVVAGDMATALAKARELGDGKHSFPLSSSEELSYVRHNDDTEDRFVECSFTYDYEARDTAVVFAEVATQTVKDPFGPWSIAISGTCVAASETAALTFARTFKHSGGVYVTTQDQEVTDSVVRQGTGTLWRKVTFAYGYQVANGSVSLDYGRSTKRDWDTLTESVTYDGLARGGSEALCAAAVAGLLTGMGAYRKQGEGFTPAFRVHGGQTVLDGYRFTIDYTRPLSASEAPGSIIEAEVTVESTYSVNHAVITPIPYGSPHVQENVGITPGAVRVTGQARGTSETALKSWATGKRALAPSGGHETPGTYGITTVATRWQPDNAQIFRCSFAWSWEYDVLNRT